ncbi:MAG: preprotein translocase subunit SecG [Alphaproteobacteria bacterium]
MITLLLILHATIALVLIVIVLLQKSEGGSLGFGGGGNSMLSVRGTANFLTRTTAILATIFMAVSLLLAILFSRDAKDNQSILDELDKTATPIAPDAVDKPSGDIAPSGEIDSELKPFDTTPTAPDAE